MKQLFTILISTIVFLIPSSMVGQSGCTDTQAINYSENAITNDGSCLYETTNDQLRLLTALENDLNEASGLAINGSDLWILNDGGNKDEIYRVDSISGDIISTVEFPNASNQDWEDMAQSDSHFFIGDFGNNSGSRTNLRIYKMNKSVLPSSISPNETIAFSYEDQTDFSENNNNHNFDCEAFFFYQDSLHLFTKNWADNRTKYYVLPATAGTHIAKKRGTFNTEGLITGADIAPDGTIALVGYTPVGITFMWLLFDYESTNVLSGNKRRIELGSAVSNGQVEGVAFLKDGYGYVVSENISILPPKLLAFESSQWTSPLTSVNSIQSPPYSVLLAPNPIQNELQLKFGNQISGNITIEILNLLGQQVYSHEQVLINEKELLLEGINVLETGIYYLNARQGNYEFTLPFQKIK